MSYFNNDVAGLFTGNHKKRRRGDVAGTTTGRKRTTDDVAGDFDRRKRRTDDVAGDFDRRRKRRTDDVAGDFDRRRKRRTDDVAGDLDRRRKNDDTDVLPTFDDFKIRVKATIDSEDICRAVRRCLINDLVAGIQDENDNDRKKRHKRR